MAANNWYVSNEEHTTTALINHSEHHQSYVLDGCQHRTDDLARSRRYRERRQR